ERQEVLDDVHEVGRIRDPLGQQLPQQVAVRVAHRQIRGRCELQAFGLEANAVDAPIHVQRSRDRGRFRESARRDPQDVRPDRDAAALGPDRLSDRGRGQGRALQQASGTKQVPDERRVRRGRCRWCGGRAVAAGGNHADDQSDHQKTDGLHLTPMLLEGGRRRTYWNGADFVVITVTPLRRTRGDCSVTFMRYQTLVSISVIAGFAVFAGPATAQDARSSDTAWIRTDTLIPMRDGIHLFTVIVVPRGVAGPLPILMTRTPYEASGNAGMARRANELGLGGYILVFQDIRGRFRSEGTFDMNRPPRSGHAGTDESTDTYDTIDWLVKNVPNNNGRVGIYGVSYPGWLTAVADAGDGGQPAGIGHAVDADSAVVVGY